MVRTFQAALPVALLAVSLLISPTVFAQVQTGTPPYGSFDGGPDIINLGNLNSHYAIPIFSRAGRGMNLKAEVSFDSSVWYPVTSGSAQTWQPTYNWGWNSGSNVVIGHMWYYVVHVSNCHTQYTRWTYYDGS